MMKPTPYNYDNGGSYVYEQPRRKPEFQRRQFVSYFLNEKEAKIGEEARNGKRKISSPGLFLYLGHIKEKGSMKEKMLTGSVLQITKIDASLAELNKAERIVFKKYAENERYFDRYSGKPFVKGMTDPVSKRTMVLAGDYTHHGQAAQGYLMVGPRPYNSNDKLGFGNVILWNNIGDFVKDGFLGIDYQHQSKRNSGAAKCLDDVVRVLRVLKKQGFSGKRNVILLRTPYVRETLMSSYLRNERKIITIDDYLKSNLKDAENIVGQYALQKEAVEDESARNSLW